MVTKQDAWNPPAAAAVSPQAHEPMHERMRMHTNELMAGSLENTGPWPGDFFIQQRRENHQLLQRFFLNSAYS